MSDFSEPTLVRPLLRYPGGKFRAVKTIRGFLPRNLEVLVSPFIGGGSIELSCAADGMKVFGSDAFSPLVVFWNEALNNPVKLAEKIGKMYPLPKSKFYEMQKNFHLLKRSLDVASVFYILNRASFSGTTLSGGMSAGHPRFTESSIARVAAFSAPTLEVECLDYKDALMKHPEEFLYLDPPYANDGRLYGDRGDMHSGFNHEEMNSILLKRDGWILSYDDNNVIRDMYKNFVIKEPEWSYGMSSNKKSKEILILNA